MICERNWGFVFIVLSRPQCQWMNAMNDWMCIGNCDCCDGSSDECEHNLCILIQSTYILRQFVLHCVVRDAMCGLYISLSIEFVAFWYYLCTSCLTWPLSIAHCYTCRAHTQSHIDADVDTTLQLFLITFIHIKIRISDVFFLLILHLIVRWSECVRVRISVFVYLSCYCL